MSLQEKMEESSSSEENTEESTEQKSQRWGNRVLAERGSDGTYRPVDASEIGMDADDLAGDKGRAAVREAVRDAYSSDDSPYDPFDRPLRILRDVGEVEAPEEDRLRLALAQERGVDPSELDI